MNYTQLIAEIVRGIISVEGWMVFMLVLSFCGVIGVVRICTLLQRILEELQSRPSSAGWEDSHTLRDVRLD